MTDAREIAENCAAEPVEQTNTEYRRSIQAAVENLAKGLASEADCEVLADRDVMYHATLGQALDVIEALRDRTAEAPVEVMWAAAATLCTRVKQSPSSEGNCCRVPA